jgi:alkylhydroperoxidase family enzyme
MTDPFLPLLDEEETEVAVVEAGLPASLSAVHLFRATFNHPPIGRIFGEVVRALVLDSVLDARTREVAILRVGWRIGSVYEWSNHVPIGRRAGLTDQEIVAVREPKASSDVLTETDRCAIAVVDEVLDGVSVSLTTLARARALLGDDRATLELLTIPGLYRAIGTVLMAGEIRLEDHVQAWPPDGLQPGQPAS